MSDKINTLIIEYMFKVFKTVKHNMSISSESAHITAVQFEALFFIKKNKEVAMNQISEHFSTTMPTATSLVDKLIAAKLAIRRNDSKDRRIVKISITKQGEKILSEAVKHRTYVMNKMLSYLSEEDKVQLLKIFQKIVEKTENEK